MSSVPSLSTLQRPSGAFAMLAVDQREAMRAMLQADRTQPVTDADLRWFKRTAAEVLSPAASAILIDQEFAWRDIIASGVVAPSCALISSADRFIPSADELVADVEIDRSFDIGTIAADGAQALKLLVIYRRDQSATRRIEMVEEFVDLCRGAGLISIIEPVAKAPADARWDWDDDVVAAARELGARGADLYKAEMPMHGVGARADLQSRLAQLDDAIASPWVVLSSGVSPDAFPDAVTEACHAGASGFLAGRAVWAPSIGAADVEESLRTDALKRLERLCGVVDEAVAR